MLDGMLQVAASAPLSLARRLASDAQRPATCALVDVQWVSSHSNLGACKLHHFFYTVCEMKPQPLGQFEQLVMTAVLQCGRDAYGVTIHRGAKKLSGSRKVSLGAVYATLDRLEDKGLVSSWLSNPTPERGGRSKRCYRLEADGERALRESALYAQRIFDALEEAWGSFGSRSSR
jgi:DNA-binding PadR family transcriptional regulator